MLQEHVAAKCSEDKIVLSTYWRDMLQGFVAGTKPQSWHTCDLLNFMGHVAEANFAQNSCCASEKEPVHTRGCVAATCPWGTSRQLFHKCANSAIWSLLHFPSIEPCKMSHQCVLNAILSLLHLQQHVPATCPLVWAHLYIRLLNCSFMFDRI